MFQVSVIAKQLFMEQGADVYISRMQAQNKPKVPFKVWAQGASRIVKKIAHSAQCPDAAPLCVTWTECCGQMWLVLLLPLLQQRTWRRAAPWANATLPTATECALAAREPLRSRPGLAV